MAATDKQRQAAALASFDWPSACGGIRTVNAPAVLSEPIAIWLSLFGLGSRSKYSHDLAQITILADSLGLSS